jgi:hypothetical protein
VVGYDHAETVFWVPLVEVSHDVCESSR